MELEYRRPLPLELHAEIHKFLPLSDAVHILVNISSRAFVDINRPRMLRNVQRIKTSLNGYIGTLVKGGNYGEELWINKDIEWNSKLDALLRYGTWLTSRRKLFMGRRHRQRRMAISKIDGMPENFIEELLNYLANSLCTQMMLHHVFMKFGRSEIPMPTFMKKLFNNKQYNQIQRRESVEFKVDNIRIETNFNNNKLHILSAKIVEPKRHFFECAYFMEFTLANKPSNGEYLFDVDLQIGIQFEKIVGITIKKRKVGDIVELKCQQHGIEKGKERNEIDNEGGQDDEGPTYWRTILGKQIQPIYKIRKQKKKDRAKNFLGKGGGHDVEKKQQEMKIELIQDENGKKFIQIAQNSRKKITTNFRFSMDTASRLLNAMQALEVEWPENYAKKSKNQPSMICQQIVKVDNFEYKLEIHLCSNKQLDFRMEATNKEAMELLEPIPIDVFYWLKEQMAELLDE